MQQKTTKQKKIMNKKQYQQPKLHVVNIINDNLLLDGSVKSVRSNAGLNYGGAGGSESARGRESADWADDEE